MPTIRLLQAITGSLRESPMIARHGKTVTADGVPLKSLKVVDVKKNIVVIRQDDPSAFFPEGFTLVYFMDSEAAAGDMAHGKIPYLMVPIGTRMSGGSPITDVWKGRFAKKGTGQEHILGLLQASSLEDEIYIDMMSVRAGYRRNSINTLMIDALKQIFPKAKVTYSTPTSDGTKFISKYKSTIEEPPPTE